MFAQAIELSLKGQVTFWKLCLLVVFMALIKSIIRFFYYNNCFQAEKCIYIPVLASTISNRVSMLTRATELMVFGYQVSVTPTKKNPINSMALLASVIRNC